MKSFIEFIGHEPLEEGFVKSGSIMTYAARARAEGINAKKAFKRGNDTLRAGTRTAGPEERLERLENAFEALFDGLSHSCLQVGNAVAVDVAGHMLAARERRRSSG